MHVIDRSIGKFINLDRRLIIIIEGFAILKIWSFGGFRQPSGDEESQMWSLIIPFQ